MNTAPLTLNQLFSLKNKELPPDQLSALEAGGEVAAAKAAVLKRTKGVGWGVISGEIFKKVENLLEISIPNILVAAWSPFLVKYLDRKKYPANEILLVPLAEHTITSEHHPYLEIMVNDQLVGKIGFKISVDLTLEGIILKIQNGEVKKISTGTCKGKGTIKCGDLLLVKEEAKSLALPGSIDLSPGVPITP